MAERGLLSMRTREGPWRRLTRPLTVRPTPKTQAGTTGLKLLQGFLERMLFWTIVVVLGAVVLIVLQLLGYG
jgi:hypothetical protein